MREILFRGKRKDNGEWVEGDSLIHSMYKKGDVCIGVVEGMAIHSVIPETVSEFTSLTDKNGKKIFEGDILGVTVNEMGKPSESLIELGLCDEKTKIPTGNKIKTVWTVEHKNQFCFGIGFYLYGKDRRFNIKLSQSALFNANAEVIGNIHDNPELLKEREGE